MTMRFSLKQLTNSQRLSLSLLIFSFSLIPLGRLVAWGFADALGANPIEKILREMGYWTLVFLLLTLSVTPIRLVTGWPWVGRFRRMIGLFAFFYASLHLMSYVGLDQFFDWSNIVKDVVKRPYITIGFAAFLALIPLAVTSSDGMLRWMGGRAWRRLHRWVYLIGFAGCLHFLWLVKKDISRPAIFISIFGVLMVFRLVRQRSTPVGGS
jgi:sulfoxide reductase heme-binding subunit YedZ